MVIGVEIGGTKQQIALGNADGTLIKTVRGKVDVKDGNTGILHWLKDNLEVMISEQQLNNTQIDAIGVGFGGPLDSKTGMLLRSVQVSGWDNFNLKNWFENTFSIPTYIYNDSSAAGWGEYVLGSGKGTRQFFYTNIGSGIGGSLIINGELYDGQGVGAGELGQSRIADWTAKEAGTDNRLEALCSGWAINNRLQTLNYVPQDSLMIQLCYNDISKLNCEILGKAVAENDDFAIRELNRVAKGMSMALATILCLFQPERIAIGGGVSLIGKPLFDMIRKHTKERQFISNEGRYDIVQCKLGEAIVLQGAVLLAAKELEKGEDHESYGETKKTSV